MTKTSNKSKCNQKHKSHFISEDVDLSLEVEIDEEVKDIINSPRKCASALLDVTIIKPQDIEKLYTVQKKTLKGDDEKKLIAAMNLDKKEVKKAVNYLMASDNAQIKCERHDLKSAGDYQITEKDSGKKYVNFFDKFHKLCSTDETNSEDIHCKKNSNKTKQVYTTPRTFNDVNKMFACRNRRCRDCNLKPDMPCPCENCAVIGLVADSQKKPFATETMYDPREMSFDEARKRYEREKKRKTGYKEEDHTHCEVYFRYLSKRIRELEDRLAIQEEKSVPRDYFKRIITKLVTHLTKLSGGQHQHTSSSPKDREYYYKDPSYSKQSYEHFKHKYNIHPVLVTSGPTTNPVNIKKEAPPSTNSQPIWKWGEEILKPGIDIKNKIVLLLEDTVRNLRWGKASSNHAVNVNSTIENLAGNLFKTVEDIPERDSKDYFRKKTTFCDSLLSVGLLNTSDWEESQMSLKYEISEIALPKNREDKKNQEYYKTEFLKIISNTKEEDRRKLWTSIWNQAIRNRQTKRDKATIQLPSKKDPKFEKIVEIEYTLGELELLLLDTKK